MSLYLYGWRDGELNYCERLVRNRGNLEVPRDQVAAYLATQIAAARKDNRYDVADEIGKLLLKWNTEEGT